MKTLLLLRHAKSSWEDTKLDDHNRPLNERGKKDAPVMGDYLKNKNLTPDLIISSTAKRAKDTSKLVAKQSLIWGNCLSTPAAWRPRRRLLTS